MPDSDWSQVTGQEQRDAERKRKENNGDLPGHKHTQSERREQPSPNTTYVFIEDIYSNLTYAGIAPPPAVKVRQGCDKCHGHTDALTNDALQPIQVHYEPAHVGENQWGSREGDLFQNVRVTGTVLRRISKQARFSDGTSHHPKIRWEKRTINHDEARPYIAWKELVAVNCAHGVGPGSISFGGFEWPGQEEEEGLRAAIAKFGLGGEGVAFADDAGVLSNVLEAAISLKRPRFTVSAEGAGRWSVMLEEAAPGQPKQDVGRLELTRPEGVALLTTASWRPAEGSRARAGRGNGSGERRQAVVAKRSRQ